MRARSVLYVPASRASAVAKARGLEVDVVILDLEDAVGPGDKATARHMAVEALTAGGFRAATVGVRLNGSGSPWDAEDLAAAARAELDLIVVPKIEARAALTPIMAAVPDAAVWAMIETPAALFALETIAATLADRPGSGLMLGSNDLSAALGCGSGADRAPLHWAMSAVVAAARAHDLLAIDAVFNALDDDDGLRAECEQGLRWGFDGKSLIHPRQVEIATQAFSPTPEQIAQAQAIVAAYATPESRESGAILVHGRMVERLHLDRARRLLALHAKTESA